MKTLMDDDLFDRLLIQEIRRSNGQIHLMSSFLDFLPDTYDWPGLEKQTRDDYERSVSIDILRSTSDLRIITIRECEELFATYSDILRDKVEEFTVSEIEGVILPLTSNLPLPFSMALILQLLPRVDWSSITELWSARGDGNPELLELRRMIVEDMEYGTLFSALPGLSSLPFLNRTEDEWDGGIKSFLQLAGESTLSLDELDFIVSMGYWLFGDGWGEFQAELEVILKNNFESCKRLNDVDYRFYIRRSLFPM